MDHDGKAWKSQTPRWALDPQESTSKRRRITQALTDAGSCTCESCIDATMASVRDQRS